MVLTCLPYWWLGRVTPAGLRFLGFFVGLDDQCVYLAWMKQAAEGHFFFRSLWTNEPQHGLNVHLLFWLLGLLARVTALSLPVAYHVGRVLLGGAVLVLFYRLTAFFTMRVSERRAALALAALSAGFGWIFQAPETKGPVDWWQAEAITFQSLCTSTLFCAGLALMLGIFCALLAAERTGRRGWALVAGACGSLLANIHSYDVFTVVAVWTSYLFVRSVLEQRLPIRSLLDALLAAALALPGVAYQVYVYTHETVFRERADLTVIHSPVLWKYLLGYGLLLPLAVRGGRDLLRRHRPEEGGHWACFPVVWAVVGFLVPYLPCSFQRKLVMGLHLPLALLAGVGLGQLAWALTLRAPRRLASRGRLACAAAVVALTMPTNVIRFQGELRRAVSDNVSEDNMHPVFWSPSEFAALGWADRHLPADAVMQAFTVTASLIPPFTGRRVWAGHWSETPSFRPKMFQVMAFFGSAMPPEARLQFLEERGITHLLFGPQERAWDRTRGGQVESQLRAASFLVPLYTSGSGDEAATIYAVRDSRTARG
jgi:hypothetical protein